MGEREHHEGCEAEGLYPKYHVTRVDGADAPGGRHEGCWYFVLDPKHDAYARIMLRLYADLVMDERPELAADLLRRPEIMNDVRWTNQVGRISEHLGSRW
jgi:hypothetical protein